MARKLCIVSRQHPDLYAYLRRRFPDDEALMIVLDRRLGRRRADRVQVARERRTEDRRVRPEVDELLQQRSLVIVTIEDRDERAAQSIGGHRDVS